MQKEAMEEQKRHSAISSHKVLKDVVEYDEFGKLQPFGQMDLNAVGICPQRRAASAELRARLWGGGAQAREDRSPRMPRVCHQRARAGLLGILRLL